jgi:hypothetical protein
VYVLAGQAVHDDEHRAVEYLPTAQAAQDRPVNSRAAAYSLAVAIAAVH